MSETTVKEKLMYSVPEVAKLLGLSRGNAYKQVRENQIPYRKVGKRILIPKVDIERLVGSAGVDTFSSISENENVDTETRRGKDTKDSNSPNAIPQISKISPGVTNSINRKTNNNPSDINDTKRIADALEELIAIRKKNDPENGICPIVIG